MNPTDTQTVETGQRTALFLAVAACGSGLLFALANITCPIPGGELAFAVTRKALQRAIAAPLAVAGLIAGGALLLRLLGAKDPLLRATRVALPALLLLVRPLTVFLLHPLGVPLWIGALATPLLLKGVAAAIGGLFFLEEARDTPSARKLESLFARLSPRAVGSMVFILASVFYMAASLQNDRWKGLVGDEPHYLLLTESLLRHQTSDQSAALNDPAVPMELRRIRPHRAGLSPAGKIFSVHHIGLPALLVAPQALLGYRGVLLFFNLAAGLVALNIFLLTHAVTGRKGLAAGVALLMAATVPLVFYFRCIYPDLIGALFAVYAFRVFREGPGAAVWRFGLAGALAAFLPWLHVKYLVLAGCLGAFYLARDGWKAWRRLTTLAAFYAISGAAMMAYFYSSLGTWKPTAQYGESHAVISPFVFRGAAGLFWDRDHGLLAYSPYFLLAVAGLWPLWRDRRRDGIGLLFIILPTFVVVSSHWMWWGGPCPAGRFILPILPFLAPLVAMGLDTLRSSCGRAAVAVPIVFSLAVATVCLADPIAPAFHRHVGYRLFPALDGYPALPLFFIHRSVDVPASSWTFLAFWMLPVACLAGWGALANRLRAARPAGGIAPILCGTAFAGFLVLLPGLFGIAYHRLAGSDPRVIDADRPLAQLNFSLNELFQPLKRAKADASAFVGRLPRDFSKTLILKRKAEGTFSEARTNGPLWVLTGPYTTLYPLRYRVEFTLTATGEAGREIGRVSVSANKGGVILGEKPFAAQEGDQAIVVEIHPGKIERDVEFRACLTAPGRLTVKSVALSAMAPDC